MQWKIYPWIYFQGLKANIDPFLKFHGIPINVAMLIFVFFIISMMAALWYFYKGLLEESCHHFRWFLWTNLKRARRDLTINDERRYLAKTCLDTNDDFDYKKAWKFYNIARHWENDDRIVALQDAKEDLRIWLKLKKVIERQDNNRQWFCEFRRMLYRISFGFQGLKRYDYFNKYSFFGEPKKVFYYWFPFFIICIFIVCPYLYEYQAPFAGKFTFFDVDIMLKHYGHMYDSTFENFNCYADDETTIINKRDLVANKRSTDYID